ncbi:hypothetical protein B0A55_04242 [Friedmanniomyces simplex]|uniref:Uncharacterized protein n=1 Tax=Friedmanniomyces simplex TaxID=329884 RepID=A0A4U0XUV0_9PEZI|nr:hypothetical protein B0A55_04242 [Friedmanniomyces simplex]
MASQVVMAEPAQPSHDPQASISIRNFRWQSADHKLQSKVKTSSTPIPNPPLGVLSAFSGNFSGTGFNTIFRPNSGPPSGTTFTNEVTPAPPTAPSENVLELNLTTETLNFGSALATTADPPLAASIVRMGSIPHGTTINAQSLEPTQTFPGPPVIPAVDLTPFVIGSSPPIKIPFASQTATNTSTPRIPQDLSAFIAAGTITQAILTDPNTVLRNANTGKIIIKTEVFTVSTAPSAPELGGGVANIAFLTGTTSAGPNANPATMTATFWINTVQSTLTIPSGSAPLRVIQTPPPHPGARVPSFVLPPTAHPVGERTITVTHTEIQYSQTVNLNFAGLTWPHVSVATLVPTAELHVVPEHDGDDDGGAALGPRIVGQ